MLVQIYETQNAAEAKKLEALGVDHIGVLVGKGKFPRELDYKQTREIFQSLTKSKKVALTLADNLAEVSEVVEKTRPDILHIATIPESLPPSDVKILKRKFPWLKIMRTIPIIDESSIALAKPYDNIADYLLLDSHEKGDKQVGATGKVHDWNISRAIVKSVKIPVILAGGLGPDNVAEAIRKVQPAGVDSKTKTDKDGGPFKDMKKVEEFVRIAKSV